MAIDSRTRTKPSDIKTVFMLDGIAGLALRCSFSVMTGHFTRVQIDLEKLMCVDTAETNLSATAASGAHDNLLSKIGRTD